MRPQSAREREEFDRLRSQFDAALRRLSDDTSALMAALVRVGQAIDKDELKQLMNGLREAKRLPADNARRLLWELVGTLSPRDAIPILKALPPTKPQHRPRGAGKVVSDKELINEAVRLVQQGAARTTAARIVLRDRGCPPDQLKDRADYLVKLLRKRGIKFEQ
jgi:hypothetical protein